MAVSVSKKINRLVARKQQQHDIDIENEDDNKRFDSDSNDDEASDDEQLQKAHYVDVGESELRKDKDQLQLDEKYTGTIGSRNALFNTDRNTNIPEDDIISEESESESESDAMSFKTDSEEEIESDNESEEEQNEEKLSHIINKETQSAINKLSQLTKIDAQKGYSILKQTKFFENIVDLRIKLQKLINLINKLPLSPQSYDSNHQTIIEKNNKLLLKICNNLFNLRSNFQINDNISTLSKKDNKKRSYSDLLNDTDLLDNDLQKFRSIVLNKWSNKIQMASGSQQLNNNKFKSINQPTNIQVENQLANMDRLVKRTRLNRNNIKPFNFDQDLQNGKLPLLSNNNIELEQDDNESIDIPKNYDPRKKDNSQSLDLTENPYIFNDEDFYRLLLNDLLDKKLNDTSSSNNNEITIKSTNSNNTNNKIRKNIDTKASKGRKLNFAIQDPIAHFETPINQGYRWSDEQIDEFFAGLLGQKIDFNEFESDEEIENNKESDIAIQNDDIQIFG
ncbi:protein Bfr2p [Monosporozyma unispora]|nr:rRNA-processing protein bfr2 [Kazachstania unispora]